MSFDISSWPTVRQSWRNLKTARKVSYVRYMSERNDLEANEGLLNSDFPDAVDVDPSKLKQNPKGFKTACIVFAVFALAATISLAFQKKPVRIINLIPERYDVHR